MGTEAPCRRVWQPPEIGTMFRRRQDGVELWVRNVYRADRQVLLANTDGGHRVYVFAHDLARDWDKVVS